MNATVLTSLVLFVVAVAVLWVGAEQFVEAAIRIARRFGVSATVVGLTVVAVGTSLPEIAVTVEASLAGRSVLAVGNVVGSNIYNIAVVLGLVSLVRLIRVSQRVLHRDVLAVSGATALLLLVLLDGAVSRLEGLGLLAAYVAYVVILVRYADSTGPERLDVDPPKRFDALRLVGGLVLVVVAGQVLVDAAVTLAQFAGVSDYVIGATVVAVGTSTPELAVSVVALTRGRSGVSVGNVLGSNLLNVLVVLGLAATIQPLASSAAAFDGALWLAGLTALLAIALWTGRRLTRPEGGLLVGSEAVRWLLGFG
ncbi:calcium/sodium antiporter [Haloprofundus sp. MHR1]|uniref:calcium/sodium antiporter n=1 Tax=Haloprofundus sp. MHR1 TaxID=2572921 RepID=UPI0010BF21B9|nr:calcium/sodium antiporter [Haloprofundus sp. MHR1]QCJ47334.1 calcium/sodium antiporter [Haloprofundus sp. MHR1]